MKTKEEILKETGVDFDRLNKELPQLTSKILRAMEMYNVQELKSVRLQVITDCSTCKHRAVSKYVEPCYGCRDNDGYDNFERQD